MIEKQETFDSEQYRRWIASLPCVITGARNVQAAHIRIGADAGTGRKPPDFRCIPLSVEQHDKQHDIGELKFWYPYGGHETARVFARSLYNVKFDTPAAVKLITEYRWRWVNRSAIKKPHNFIDQRKKGEDLE